MPQAPHIVPAAHPLRTLFRYNRRHWRVYAVGASLAVLFTGISLFMPFVIRAIVAGFEQGTMTHRLLLGYFAALLLAAALTGIVRYFQRMLMIGASRRFEYDLRNGYFAHIERLPQRFFNKMQTGDIMARATSDINQARELVGPGIMGTVDMIRIPVTLAGMVYMSGKLTFYALFPLPLVSLMVYALVRYMHYQSRIVQEVYARVTSRVQENLAGARVVKAYGIADRETGDFLQECQAYMRANVRLVALMSFAFPLIGILVGVVLITVIWQGGGMVIRAELALADLTGFLILMVMLVWPLAQFGWILTVYQRGIVSMKRINDILLETPEIQDGAHTNPDARVHAGHLVFDQVGFSYAEEPILREISFEAAPGATLALVGPTGSGKTALVSLLAREYDPQQGRILLDGHDISTIPLAELRRALGYVPQDTFIFSDTVRANLSLGRPDASEEDIWAACGAAQLSETIQAMPAGLDTLLGERGINLSGGQKQRLTLARAILCDPKVLVLDDALSSVDTHTEERILQGLRTVLEARTSILISHRVSTVRDADRILVLDEGRIVEQGDHEELVALDGLYAAMYRRQQLETALEDVA